MNNLCICDSLKIRMNGDVWKGWNLQINVSSVTQNRSNGSNRGEEEGDIADKSSFSNEETKTRFSLIFCHKLYTYLWWGYQQDWMRKPLVAVFGLFGHLSIHCQISFRMQRKLPCWGQSCWPSRSRRSVASAAKPCYCCVHSTHLIHCPEGN